MWRSLSKSPEISGVSSPKIQRPARTTENHLMMLSPKLQRPIRVNENQLLMLAEKAKFDRHTSGYLHKRSSDSTKWHLRWFNLYQNLLFYYENESSSRPSGLILLEGSYCERLVHTSSKEKEPSQKYCLSITYRRENQRQYDLKASSEEECRSWIDAIRQASFNKLLLQREELEQKHIHLLQIVESEKTAKWQYTQQCEELTTEIKKLRCELCTMKKEWRIVPPKQSSDSEEIRKIKKVQSFFRGWLCRRRWKQIVEEYIKSPHAENMRKRNSLVFRMVEAEEEYVGQLNDLITGFLRPFKMAASSKMPPCSHEDVNSIFLNSETILFLHQIFLKGLSARMDSWPTLVLDNNRPVHAPLGDLFDMLLPMLSIYQEYVRNHHFSIQVLTECKQQSQFATFLSRLESKPAHQGRSLETFLTYPMHQIPRYILTLHELLAHTPHNHVERKSLDEARKQLEQLSRQMHDEVSETENIRKNLAIERMIAQRCEILLDVNQVFVRQGSLMLLTKNKAEKSALKTGSRLKLESFHRKSDKDKEKNLVCQCFLFTNHLILATRSNSGQLQLVNRYGRISLSDTILIEDPSDSDEDSECESSSSGSSMLVRASVQTPCGRPVGLDFILMVDQKGSRPWKLHLAAATIQEKNAWVTDISQCLDNVQFSNWFRSSVSEVSSVMIPHSFRNDPKLFRDDTDIRFSKTLNSCKIPQIRYATSEKILERLTDLRFLSIDFLNTFLLTYRVFTNSMSVLNCLKNAFFAAEKSGSESTVCDSDSGTRKGSTVSVATNQSLRRISTTSTVSGVSSCLDGGIFESPIKSQHWRWSHRRFEDEMRLNGQSDSLSAPPINTTVRGLQRIREQPSPSGSDCSEQTNIEEAKTANKTAKRDVAKSNVQQTKQLDNRPPAKRQNDTLPAPSSETFKIPIQMDVRRNSDRVVSAIPEEHSDEITAGENSDGGETGEMKSSDLKPPSQVNTLDPKKRMMGRRSGSIVMETEEVYHGGPRDSIERSYHGYRNSLQSYSDIFAGHHAYSYRGSVFSESGDSSERLNTPRGSTFSRTSENPLILQRACRKRMSTESAPAMFSPQENNTLYSRGSFQVALDASQMSPKAGVVVTSYRQCQRRSSNCSAASAFAIATAGSSNPQDFGVGGMEGGSGMAPAEAAMVARVQEVVTSNATTMRVLNVLRHWVAKHFQDFECDEALRISTIQFLEDLLNSRTITPSEQKSASQLHLTLTQEGVKSPLTAESLLLQTQKSPAENIREMSALTIAEQMTHIDHSMFSKIRREEFLSQNWMRSEKMQKAPHIVKITHHFNEISRLILTSILTQPDMQERVQSIEKWAAVGDICRCLQNFNGVLQICASFDSTPVFRLKRTWEKVNRTAKQTIDRLRKLISFEGNFRNLRDALHRCDPPCIPYLGMYLSELSFIEEGTPNFTEDGLLNFAKMRMIAHVIRENRRFQATPYKIEMNERVAAFLLDTSHNRFSSDQLFQMSCDLEPRARRISSLAVPTQDGVVGGELAMGSRSKPRLSMGSLGKSLVSHVDARRSSFS